MSTAVLSAPTAGLVSARRAAARFRAEWLVLVLDGTVTIDEVIQEACRPDAEPLLRITLRQLLLAQPGWGRHRTDSLLKRLSSACGGDTPDRRRLTIGWLLDPRAAGRRHGAWLDAFEPKRTPPSHVGFPYIRSSNV